RVQTRDESASAFETSDDAEVGASYLLTRDTGAVAPSSATLPTVSGLVHASRVVSDVLLRGARAVDIRERAAFLDDPEVGATLRQIVTGRLHAVVERASGLPADLEERLRELERLLGIDVVDSLVTDDDGATVAGILQPGARVCFTGTARSPQGRTVG